MRRDLKKYLHEYYDTQISPIAQIKRNIKNYLSNNSFISFTEQIKESVIGQDAGVEAMCLQVYKWLISVASGRIQNHNTILAAASGCGKTAFYFALKDTLTSIGIPIINFDASSITPVLYVGNDYTSIFDDMCAVNSNCQGIGICFLVNYKYIILIFN